MSARKPLVLVNGQPQQLQAGDSIASSDPAAIGSYAPGSISVSDGQYSLVVKELQLTGAQRLTVAGTGRLTVI